MLYVFTNMYGRIVSVSKTEKKDRKNIWNIVFIVAVILVVILVILLNGDISETWQTITNADYRWMLAAFGAWFVFMLLDAEDMHFFFRRQKIGIRYHHTVIASLIGMFYSNITPAATGGQPMQVVSLRKHGVQPGVASSCLAVKFFSWEVALLLVGTIFWIIDPAAFGMTATKPVFFVILGYIINGFIVLMVLLLVISPKLVDKLVNFILRIGKALHLVKDLKQSRAKLDKSINEFNSSVYMIKHKPLQLISIIFINMLRVVALMSITYFVYRAVGLGVPGQGDLPVAGFLDILTIQTLLYITVSFFPMPGASGAQEFGFSGFFSAILGGKAGAMLLIWRFFTYYLMILFGFVGVLLDSIGKGGSRKAVEDKADVSADTAV